MKNQRSTEIKVGITVLIGLILFIYILSWTKNFSFTSSDQIIKVMFDNVSGLETGNNVTVNGVKEGFVKDIDVYNTSVIVTISVDNEIEIKEDAIFSLAMTDLMGGRKIEINPGNSEVALDLNKVHNGEYLNDIAGLVASFNGMEGNISKIMEGTTDVLNKINLFLSDENFTNNLKETVNNFRQVSIKLDQLLTENRENLKVIAENTKEITNDTRELIKNNKVSIENSITSLNTVIHKSDSLITTLNLLADQTVSGKNNLGKILYDDSLFVQIKESIQHLQDLSKTVIEQLNSDGIKVDASIF